MLCRALAVVGHLNIMVHRAAGAVSVLISRRTLVPRVLLNQQSILHTVVPRVLRPGR
jgi:hypothetical protein